MESARQRQSRPRRKTPMPPSSNPTITMRDFFALPEVIDQQQIQKANPCGSPAHRQAFANIKALAAKFGADDFIGDY